MLKQFIVYDKNYKIDIKLSCNNFKNYIEKYKNDLESEQKYFSEYLEEFFDSNPIQYYSKSFIYNFILGKLYVQPENFTALYNRLDDWFKIQIKLKKLTKGSNKFITIIRTKDIKKLEKNK